MYLLVVEQGYPIVPEKNLWFCHQTISRCRIVIDEGNHTKWGLYRMGDGWFESKGYDDELLPALPDKAQILW